jgi:hypothetical protein
MCSHALCVKLPPSTTLVATVDANATMTATPIVERKWVDYHASPDTFVTNLKRLTICSPCRVDILSLASRKRGLPSPALLFDYIDRHGPCNVSQVYLIFGTPVHAPPNRALCAHIISPAIENRNFQSCRRQAHTFTSRGLGVRVLAHGYHWHALAVCGSRLHGCVCSTHAAGN